MRNRKSRRIREAAKPSLPKYSESNPIQPPLLIRNLPGIQKFEDFLRLNMPMPDPIPADIEEVVDAFSMSTFGIKRADVSFKWPDDYDPGASKIIFDEGYERRRETEHRFRKLESKFKTANMDDIAAVKHLLQFGIDFMDINHRPLLCASFLCRQAEAVALGYAGCLPDRTKIERDRWEENMVNDIADFKSKKRNSAFR